MTKSEYEKDFQLAHNHYIKDSNKGGCDVPRFASGEQGARNRPLRSGSTASLATIWRGKIWIY